MVIALLMLCLGAAAWLTWLEARPPRCPSCGARTAAQHWRIVTSVARIVETVYQCPRCRSMLCRRDAPTAVRSRIIGYGLGHHGARWYDRAREAGEH